MSNYDGRRPEPPYPDPKAADPDPIRAALEDTLFDAIKHGDQDHQYWLKEAIRAHFAGDAVPPATGDSRKRAALEQCVKAMEAVQWTGAHQMCPSEKCTGSSMSGRHSYSCPFAAALTTARNALDGTGE